MKFKSNFWALLALSQCLSIGLAAEPEAKDQDAKVSLDIMDQAWKSLGNSLELPKIVGKSRLDKETGIWNHTISFSTAATLSRNINVPFSAENPKSGGVQIVLNGLRVVLSGRNSAPKTGESPTLNSFDILLKFLDQTTLNPSSASLIVNYGQSASTQLDLDSLRVRVRLDQSSAAAKILNDKNGDGAKNDTAKEVATKIYIAAILGLFRKAPSLTPGANDVRVSVPAQFDLVVDDGKLVEVDHYFNTPKPQ